MPRQLLTTSAIALATWTMTAIMVEAADWEIAVGEYFESHAVQAVADSGTGQEMSFRPSITLDNGLQIGADVQLEPTADVPDQTGTTGAWAAGLNLGYAGITVGGSLGEQSDGVRDGSAWGAGVAYTTGPWGIAFTYFSGDSVDGNAGVDGGGPVGAGRGLAAPGVDDELDQYLLGLNYDLATGVALNAFGAYNASGEETGGARGPDAAVGNDVDGWVVGTGIKIRF